jgi:hypothetical protein
MVPLQAESRSLWGGRRDARDQIHHLFEYPWRAGEPDLILPNKKLVCRVAAGDEGRQAGGKADSLFQQKKGVLIEMKTGQFFDYSWRWVPMPRRNETGVDSVTRSPGRVFRIGENNNYMQYLNEGNSLSFEYVICAYV